MKTLIKGGFIIDGTGRPGFSADLLIEKDRIAQIGQGLDCPDAKVIDASGCWVTPGFINMHSHSDCSVTMYPGMQSTLGQGITTEFAGHCGLGVAPVFDHWIYMFPEKRAFSRVMPEPIGGINPYSFYAAPVDLMKNAFHEVYGENIDWETYGGFLEHLRRRGTGANLALVIGQGNLRLSAMGLDFRRPATEIEIDTMETYLEEGMKWGARGLGLGLDYQPGLFASREELLRLMKKTAELGGIVTAHTRSRTHSYYGREVNIKDGIEEFLQLGLESGAKIHICHIQNAYEVEPSDDILAESAVERTLQLVEEYRSKGVQVTWDVIPKHLFGPFHYPMAMSLFQPYVEQCHGVEAFSRMLRVGNYRELVETEIRNGNHASRGVFTRFDPKSNPNWAANYVITKADESSLVGKTITEAANGEDSLTWLLNTLEKDPYCSIMPLHRRPLSTPDRDTFVKQDEACIGMDTWTFSYEAMLNEPGLPLECGSPATYCGMTEFLYDRKGIDSPETTIQKLTGNPAKVLELEDRGILREKAVADIVILDPEELTGEEYAADPRRAPKAVKKVFVNGISALDSKSLSGKVLE